MDLISIIERLGKEWRVISSAPLSFFIAALVVGIGGWLVAKYVYKGRIEAQTATIRTQEERISFAHDQINHAKDKSGESEKVRNQLEKQLADVRRQLDGIQELSYRGQSLDPKLMDLAVSSSAAATDSFFTLKRLDNEVSEKLQLFDFQELKTGLKTKDK